MSLLAADGGAMRGLMRALAGVATLEFAVALYVIVAGGFRAQFGALRISASEPSQPFTIAVICASLAIWLSDRRGRTVSWHVVPAWSRLAVIVAAVVTTLAGVRWAVGVAGGADAYGYVSQAALWLTGDLVIAEPLADLAPWLAPSAAPLGYRPALEPGAIVPVYSPGLPLLMAVAQAIGGPDAVYLVVPLLGGLAVWCTFVIGRRLAGAHAGVLAALLTACSPMFLFHLFEPMSDLPVTAWWLAAIACALSARPSMAFAAGLAATMAVLTRPNLVPLALVVAGIVALERPLPRRVAAFALGLVPGCLAVAVVNNWLYGSPLTSGYGPLSTLFSVAWFGPNLQRYPRWLLDLHTPAILLALLAPWVLTRWAPDLKVGPTPGTPLDLKVGPTSRSRSGAAAAWLLLLFAGLVLLCYLFYIVFPAWPALRFLLPAIPLLFILASVVATAILARAPTAVRGAAAFALCGLLGSWYVQKADRLGVFLIQGSQQRYVTTGAFASHRLPPNAVVLSVIQTGTLRMYGHRSTLRWDQLRSGQLDEALAVLRDNGRKAYLLVEDAEEAAFRAQFAGASPLGNLDWPPAFELASQPIVRIYDPDDRARHVAGGSVVTEQIEASRP